MVFIDNFMYFTNFKPVKASADSESNSIKPEFCNLVITLNMDMLRLIAIPSVKEKTVWSNTLKLSAFIITV
jgi:hypothetical protein